MTRRSADVTSDTQPSRRASLPRCARLPTMSNTPNGDRDDDPIHRSASMRCASATDRVEHQAIFKESGSP
jgi:hypothetical protein